VRSAAAALRERKRLEAELERRRKKKWDPRAILGKNPQQLAVYDAFMAGEQRDHVLEGTRQLGKSFLAAVLLIEVARTKAGSDSAFVDFDKEHAEKVILRDFEQLTEEYDIPGSPRIVEERLEFSNGAKVYVFSGRPSEVRKLQGLKFALLVCDESNDAEALGEIFKMVRPALIRYGGRVLAMGIPGRVAGIGFWWDITHGKLSQFFGQHRGHMKDNPFLDPADIAAQRAAAAEELGEESGDFKRHWDGVWPDLDDELRVFKYDPEVNGYDGPPPACERYALGLDPGGVQDAEAAVMLGHELGKGEAWAVDEYDSGKGKAGDWDTTEDALSPMVKKWKPLDLFYDYGSAKKAANLVLDSDRRVRLEPVPMKDLDIEIPRINRMFKLKKLWVRKGSRLEADLLYTTWDPKERAKGKNKQSSAWKQNLGDAFRAALWAVEGYANPPVSEESPRERKQREINERLQAMENTDYSQLVDPGVTAGPDW
jgi:hypothetical protein